ncbi:ABC transporter permease [Corynebacterium lubricantis]|uniref:ABC transporter permease n=1 Tax=Corynebacterium lubricantis TaxID=541095 RepID=UPI00035EE9DB|nr:FtsX-like permease family protein [Corynebacterium lubricantis]
MNSTMRKVSLRNIAAHRVRLALTVLSVVLGTAFISGSFMFTNSLSNTFDSVMNSSYRGVDVVVGGGDTQPGVPKETADAIAADEQVDKINITGNTTVVVANDAREAIQTRGGSSSISIFYPPAEQVGQALEITEGTEPAGLDEVVLNKAAAEEFGLSLGQNLIVVDPVARHEVTVVGLYDMELDQGTSINLLMDATSYLERYTDGVFYPGVNVSAVDGVSAEDLVGDLQQEYPGLSVETGQKLADETSQSIEDALSFVNYFLIAFGLVGLLVGTFLIANTFSMIVAQRTKEFALLRALGASKGQISRSVVAEAFIVGMIGSALGIVAGVGLVAVIKAVMAQTGTPLPNSGLGLSVGAIAIPMIVGTLVTVVSAWAPARRAGQVEPVEAMRSSETATPQPLKTRTIVGVVMIALGLIIAGWAVQWEAGTTGNRASLVGVGTLLVIVGFFLAGPALSLPLVPPFGRLIGLPFGSVGKLASTNTQRNPRRTSATAFALMLGVALVTAIGMFGATMRDSIADFADNEVSAEFVLSGPQMGGFPVPNDVPDTVREVDGVNEVVFYSHVPVAVDGQYAYDYGGGRGMSDVMSGDPSSLVTMDVQEGSADLTGNTVIVPRALADENGWSVGDTVSLSAPGISPSSVDLRVGGVFGESAIFQSFLISYDAVSEIVPPQAATVMMVGVNSDGTVDHEQLRANLEAAVEDAIVVQVRDTDEMVGEASMAIDQMLSILYALLALAVIIAILGIVNTLTLSVIERRQEIGMLRAVGMQRGQVRVMIILESVQIAVFGALSGMIIGLAMGWAFLTVLADQGLETISIPWNLLITMLIGSGVVGVLAALWPAQRAAKTPPLDAITD